MTDDIATVRAMYDRFNARDIDGVLAALADDVAWANGMDGGHVRGKDDVRAYWTRQWAVVRPHVEPLRFEHASDGSIVVEVRQTVHALDGATARAGTHGLADAIVGHIFRFHDGKVARFDICGAR